MQMNGFVLLERLGEMWPGLPASSCPPTATRGTWRRPWTVEPTAS